MGHLGATALSRPSSAFCCDDCGHIHTSQYTVLDTYCPECESPRENQTLATCRLCGMPCYRDGTTWVHCDEFLDLECRPEAMPVYLRGLRRKR